MHFFFLQSTRAGEARKRSAITPPAGILFPCVYVSNTTTTTKAYRQVERVSEEGGTGLLEDATETVGPLRVL